MLEFLSNCMRESGAQQNITDFFWSRVQFSSTWWLCCSPVPSLHYVEASVNAVSVVLVKYTDIIRLPIRYVGVTRCPVAEYKVYESSSQANGGLYDVKYRDACKE